jgi:hypothetical protein
MIVDEPLETVISENSGEKFKFYFIFHKNLRLSLYLDDDEDYDSEEDIPTINQDLNYYGKI